jgi:DNA-directed RNA polymerase specialized sigma24 family protein
MNIDQCYDRLRSIGCSVETSDALASIIAELSDKKREAFFLWAMGASYSVVGDCIHCSKQYAYKIIKDIRDKWLTK